MHCMRQSFILLWRWQPLFFRSVSGCVLGTGYSYLHSCSLPRSYMMIHIPMSHGPSSLRVCPSFWRSTRWRGRCTSTSSGSWTLILSPASQGAFWALVIHICICACFQGHMWWYVFQQVSRQSWQPISDQLCNLFDHIISLKIFFTPLPLHWNATSSHSSACRN